MATLRGHAWFTVIGCSLVLSACSTIDDQAVNVAPASQPADEVLRLPLTSSAQPVQVQPSFVLTLNRGERLSFFAEEDGSVGVLEEIPVDSERGSVLEHEALRDASPAMIYFAVTGAGSDIPRALVDHHEGLAAEGRLPRLASAMRSRSRGWFLTTARAASSSLCADTTFSQTFCNDSASDESVCRVSTSGDWVWTASHVYRYRARYCLQQGSNRSWLYYREGAGDCTYWQALKFVWGLDSYLHGREYNAPVQYGYGWWRGASSESRIFRYYAGGGSGDDFNWGLRYNWEACQ